jgi:hypothetical protein
VSERHWAYALAGCPHIKHNLGVRGFLLRGLDAVRAEFSIMASCFNITRMIRLLGTERLVESLRAVAIAGNIAGLSSEITAVKLIYAKIPLRIWRLRKMNKHSAQTQTVRAA